MVLDGGDQSQGRIGYFDCPDTDATHMVLGSGATLDKIAAARAAGEAHYTVGFVTAGGCHVRQLLA
jgi:hypothetical protein